MELKSFYLGQFWGCCKHPECNGFISAKGTNLRAAQSAESEFAGRPLLPVVKERDGRYKSKDGRYVLQKVKKRKEPLYWEALDLYSGEVVLTAPSCVKLRFALATPNGENSS
jgi:hypothetical protein